jgi:hypothetical protein
MKPPYSSFITATLAGVPQVVAFTADALLGASLDDGKFSGACRWKPTRNVTPRHP